VCLGSGGREAPGISEPEPITFPRLYNIAHLHVDKGKTIREIVRDLKVSRNTVPEVLRSGETSFEYERDAAVSVDEPEAEALRLLPKRNEIADIFDVAVRQRIGQTIALSVFDPTKTYW
jgi:IS30 family transposase